MPITDEYTLLCETCGYTVDGLPVDGNCPECGRAIRASLPEAREGTPWQQTSSVSTWMDTGYAVLTTPRAAFASIRMQGSRLSGLFYVNAMTGSAIAVLSFWIACLIKGAGLTQSDPDLAQFTSLAIHSALYVGGAWVLGVAVRRALTGIERTGLRIMGRVHGWRISPATTAVVCDHASYGWVAGSVIMAIASIVTLALPIGEYRGLTDKVHWLMSAGPNFTATLLALHGLAGLAGLLIFETLVYIGVRRCKFANRARPALEAAPPGPSPATQPPA